MTSWQYYLVISCIIGAISWIVWTEARVRSLQSALNMAKWTNEKTDINTAVSQLTPIQRVNELESDLGSGPKPSA
jgi:hypothetical protein